MYIGAENVEILNFRNFENLEIQHHEMSFRYYENGTSAENYIHHVAKNVKGILLYIFLAFQLSGQLVCLVKLDAGGKPSTWFPPGRLVEHIICYKNTHNFRCLNFKLG